MSIERHRKAVRELIKSVGLTIKQESTTGSGHFMFDVLNTSGKVLKLLVSRTPSDHRAMLNTRAMLRRHAKDVA